MSNETITRTADDTERRATARLEPWKGRWRVVLTRDGRQEVLRSGLSRTQAERIAEAMCLGPVAD